MRVFIFIFNLLIAINIGAQVTKVKYLLKYNPTSISNYDAFIVITEGSAPISNAASRVQFGSQYTLVAPSGTSVSIVKRFMPLKNNINGNGDPNNPSTPPNQWNISNNVFDVNTPNGMLDFYGITNEFNSTFHYNALNLNDTIKLFSLNVILPSGACKSSLRLYVNNVDPSSTYPGMGYSDFSNGFVIGYSTSNTQDYDGNLNSIYGNENVTNWANTGLGSLRKAIECAGHDAQITFDPIIQNDTIKLLSPIIVSKNIKIIQPSTNIIKIKASNIGPIFDINSYITFRIENAHLIAQSNNLNPRLLLNNGILTLKNVLMKDPKIRTSNNLGTSILNKGKINIEGTTNLVKL